DMDLDTVRRTVNGVNNEVTHGKVYTHKLFVNRNARLQNLEERFKQKTLTLDEYLTKVSQLIGIKKY
ncbi:unnamed protein product, partial [Rotaria magnacalcarata]